MQSESQNFQKDEDKDSKFSILSRNNTQNQDLNKSQETQESRYQSQQYIEDIDENEFKNMDQKSLLEKVETIINAYKGGAQNINEEQIQMCEIIVQELMKRFIYDKAISLLSIILESDAQPKYYILRSHCYRNENLFVEAAKDLQEASSLAPNLNASISNEQYYFKMEHYYRDLDIKFW